VQSGLGAGSTIAGRYAVGETLGRGGMGEVRAGRDVRLERDVAIKLLSPEVAARPKTRERFEAEARAAARLTHANVVLVYDSGEHDGVPFLVMERLPGRTLADELAEEGPLPPERLRALGIQVLDALSAAHRAGIVHRDVKPGNVLLAADGTVKVADFGIAKSVDGADLTTTGMLLGTPSYLSPEQLAGEPATPVSDVYSVGVMLYEALTGERPFRGRTMLELLHSMHQTRPALPDDLAACDALARAHARALAPRPEDRFPTAEEMRGEIVAALRDCAAALAPRDAAGHTVSSI
jgi:serine/threonine protein kinase